MSNIINLESKEKMSHIEIAKLAGKRPDNAKRVVKDLLRKQVLSTAQIEHIQIASGKTVKVYMLNQEESYTLMARLSPEFIGKLVRRWLELEGFSDPVGFKAKLDLDYVKRKHNLRMMKLEISEKKVLVEKEEVELKEKKIKHRKLITDSFYAVIKTRTI